MKIFKAILFIAIFILAPAAASAHQPRIVTENNIIVTDPEISKAYYGKLSGEEHTYYITSDKPIQLYVQLLIPDRPGQKKDIWGSVLQVKREKSLLASMGEWLKNKAEWTPFYEEFGADNYFKVPEFKKNVPAGKYEISVRNPGNDARYALAIGEAESFTPAETLNALFTIPKLKRDFFASSQFTYLKSPFGITYLLIMFALSFIFGFIYRLAMRKFAKGPRAMGRNIGAADQWLRFGLGMVLLVLGIWLTWNPVILFLSGFCFFETFFSWCGLYAALGRNTCPLK